MKPSSSRVFSVSTNSSSTVESSLTLTSPLLSTPIQFIIKFCGFYPRHVSCLSLWSTSTVLVVGQEMAFKPVPAGEILNFRSVRVVMILKESVYISRSLYIAFAKGKFASTERIRWHCSLIRYKGHYGVLIYISYMSM